MMNWAKVVTLLLLLAFPKKSTAIIHQCSDNEKHEVVALCSLVPFYDRNGPGKPLPIEVNTSITLNSIVEFNDVLRTVRIDLILSVSWKDHRLSITDKNNYTEYWYNPTEKERKALFFPTIEFAKAREISNEPVFSPFPDQNYFWFVYQTHDFFYQQAMKVTAYCNFDFISFPFDSHHCNLTFGSAELSVLYLSLSMPTIHVNGKDCSFGPVKMDQRDLPFDIYIESQTSFSVFEAGYNYPNTGIKLLLRRNDLGLLTGSFYEPTLIFNCLSLISFAIHPDAVPGRLGLLITLYLIASNVYNSVQGPPTRGFSYIEIWMLGVHIPMLTAIFEYGFLLAIRRIRPRCIKNIEKFCNQFDKNTFFLSFVFIFCFNLCYWHMTSFL